jgi:F-type H+-transporting ATPase subunit gamma
MSDTLAGLRHTMNSAADLQSVVRTMKALAASSIGQYEKSVLALADYYRAVELGLGACFRELKPADAPVADHDPADKGPVGALVFGSDQGLVGRFNEVVAEYAIARLAALRGEPQVWAVGERVASRLSDAGLPVLAVFPVPNSARAIAPLIGQIQIESETYRASHDFKRVFVFHNRPQPGALFEPVGQRLLPLDRNWQEALLQVPWPTRMLPQVSSGTATLRALIREYHFISLFRACAESLASENASRLAAMQRADKNIHELLEDLRGSFHRLRQSTIDEELFDLISGFDALIEERSDSGKRAHSRGRL